MSSTLTLPSLRRDRLRSAPAAVRLVFAPSDLSAESHVAFTHARLIASRLRARLALYHSLDGLPPMADLGAEMVDDETRRASAILQSRLLSLAGPAGEDAPIIDIGRAADGIVSWIEAHEPGLVVMGTHGRGGRPRRLGSVTGTVLRRSSAPLLCVRPTSHGAALPYRRILVPTDLSETARRASSLATLLGAAFGAEMVALSAPTLQEAGAAGELSTVARRERADLIVMSAPGSTGVRERTPGSTLEILLGDSPCPVLVV